jgi:hypothetical protein
MASFSDGALMVVALGYAVPSSSAAKFTEAVSTSWGDEK